MVLLYLFTKYVQQYIVVEEYMDLTCDQVI